MPPALLLTLLVASLLAMLPVRRLYQAGWTPGALLTAWVGYVVGVLLGLDVGAGSRVVLPALVVLFVLPYVVGQARLERVGRLFGARRAQQRPVIDVTPPGDPGAMGSASESAPRRRGRKPPVEYR